MKLVCGGKGERGWRGCFTGRCGEQALQRVLAAVERQVLSSSAAASASASLVCPCGREVAREAAGGLAPLEPCVCLQDG